MSPRMDRQCEWERLAVLKKMGRGDSGTVEDDQREIQADKHEAIACILVGSGFRPVFAAA